MASVLRTAYVNVLPKTDDFDPELKKRLNRIDASSSGERIGKSFGGGFTGAAGKLIGGIGALFAGIQIAGFFKDSIAEAREAVKAGQLTEAVIKSTGGAAKISAGQIGDLAGALSLKTGVDDEAIQSGENLLLTFTRIHNETGKGNDIFNQASTAIVDMTAAMNNGAVTSEGLKASTIQVGKALNDPIKGMTALSKVGVTFTDQQKEQIKNFVESGNIMGAQKVILKELATEFGGAAAAAADPAQKAQVAWGNLKEQIGGIVLPLFNRFSAFLISDVIPAVQTFIAGLQGKGPIEGFAGALNTAGLGLRAMVTAFKEGDVTSDGFVGAMEQLGVTLRGVFDWLRNTGLPAAKEFGSWLANHTEVIKAVAIAYVGYRAAIIGYAIGQQIGTAATVAATVAHNAHNVATAISTSYLGTWVAVKALELGAWIRSTAATVAHTVALGAHAAIMGVVRGATIAWTAVQWLLNAALTANPIGLVIVGIGLLVGAIILIATKTTWFQTIWNAAWGWMKQVGLSFWNDFLKPFGDFFIGLYNRFAEGGRKFVTDIGNMWNSVKNATGIARDFLQGVFDGIVSWVTVKIPNAFSSFVDAAKRAWESVKAAVRDPVTAAVKFVINPLLGGFRKVAGFFGIKGAPGDIEGFATGGRIPGPFSRVDNRIASGPGGRPIAVATGEYIVNALQTKKWLPVLEAINHGHMPKGAESAAAYRDSYATGGLVGGILDFGKDLVGLFTDPAKAIGGLADAALSRIPGGGLFRDTLVGMAKKLKDGIVDKVKSAFASGTGGPVGAWPSSPAAQRGDSGVWRSIVALINSTGPMSGSFGNAYRPGDPLWHGSGRAVDWMGFNQDALASFFMARMGSVLELIHRTSNRDYAVTRGRNMGSFNNALMEQHRNHIHIAMARGGLVPWLGMDSGFGVLEPGRNIVDNGTGRREPITAGPVRLDEWTIQRLAQALQARPVQVEVTAPARRIGVAGIAP